MKALALGLLLALCGAAQAAPEVNRASQAELESLPGIGPGLAARILEERQKGPFKDWADLTGRLKGVREASAAKLSAAGLTVDGQRFPTVPTPPGAASATR